MFVGGKGVVMVHCKLPCLGRSLRGVGGEGEEAETGPKVMTSTTLTRAKRSKNSILQWNERRYSAVKLPASLQALNSSSLDP